MKAGPQPVTEALVSPTTWAEANAALAARVRPGRAATVNAEPLVRPVCGVCHRVERDGCANGRSVMYRVWVGRCAQRKAYYRCTGSGPQRTGCGAAMIACEALDAAVIEAMLSDTRPHFDLVFVAGDDISDQIARGTDDQEPVLSAGWMQRSLGEMTETMLRERAAGAE